MAIQKPIDLALHYANTLRIYYETATDDVIVGFDLTKSVEEQSDEFFNGLAEILNL